ncbi:hypothetical protein KIW84_013987 [Lathyrus oleraceus]|uniref:Uncharacterized protein n=1 Tax=Pisum sativum TaxID=3888 RepID=A0A9D5BLZ7_PEA|nr:hypothetical protein KIW84_013987 [Pisum sativum]
MYVNPGCIIVSFKIWVLQNKKKKYVKVFCAIFSKVCSDSSRIVILDYNKGKAVMVGAREKQKLVYVPNRDIAARLTISSPLEGYPDVRIVIESIKDPAYHAISSLISKFEDDVGVKVIVVGLSTYACCGKISGAVCGNQLSPSSSNEDQKLIYFCPSNMAGEQHSDHSRPLVNYNMDDGPPSHETDARDGHPSTPSPEPQNNGDASHAHNLGAETFHPIPVPVEGDAVMIAMVNALNQAGSMLHQQHERIMALEAERQEARPQPVSRIQQRSEPTKKRGRRSPEPHVSRARARRDGGRAGTSPRRGHSPDNNELSPLRSDEEDLHCPLSRAIMEAPLPKGMEKPPNLAVELSRAVGIEPPRTLNELLHKAQAYIRYEEKQVAHNARSGRNAGETEHSKREDTSISRRNGDKRREERPRELREGRGPAGRYSEYTLLTAPRERILAECINSEFKQGRVRFPKPSAPKPHTDKSKYCRFHRSHGHVTEDCVHLKDAIEILIQEGHLKQYTRKNEAPRHDEPEKKRPREDTPPDNSPYQVALCVSRPEDFFLPEPLPEGKITALSPWENFPTTLVISGGGTNGESAALSVKRRHPGPQKKPEKPERGQTGGQLGRPLPRPRQNEQRGLLPRKPTRRTTRSTMERRKT